MVPGIIIAQTDESYPKQMGFGLKAGANYSALIIGIPIQQMSADIEPGFGLVFNYIDKKTVGIQLELNYVSKSWEENPIGDATFNARLNYIEIPILTTLHFGNKFKFIVNFGPYLAILLNEESNHTVDEASFYFPYYENRNPRQGDFGMTGGGGLRFQNKLGIFQLEARYSFGFQNIYDNIESGIEFSNLSTIGVFLSYQLSLSNDQ